MDIPNWLYFQFWFFFKAMLNASNYKDLYIWQHQYLYNDYPYYLISYCFQE